MEKKLYDKNAITLDGRLDEAIWETAEAHTGFKKLKCRGATTAPAQATFRILPCEDRIYFGIRCEEPNIDKVVETHSVRSKWCTDSVELFLSPSGNSFEFYQFLVTLGNHTASNFHSEGGNIHPDPYAPMWRHATYVGEDFWSAEVELPLTAFYMTPNACWNDNWLVNVCRTRSEYYEGGSSLQFYTWSDLVSGFIESANFRSMEGFPMRPAKDDIRISSASVNVLDKTDRGFEGVLTVQTTNPEDAEFSFSSDCAEEVCVKLKQGENKIQVPCCFEKDGRGRVQLKLTRKSDGMVFMRWYPVRVTYEPIKLQLTLPEYRGNFYPGQDYTKIAGRILATKPVTVTLEGPGIKKQTVPLDAEGNFLVETPNFEIGDAFLTITDSVNTLTKKIRRLAPSKHTMSWISGGNLIVNGKPVLRRNMYAEYYHGGEAFKLKYDADDLHQTKEVRSQAGFITPGRLMKGADAPGGEATFDQKPSEEMYRRFAKALEDNKDRDFVYYYLDDEPECRGVSPVYLKYLYDFIADQDPYHVILIGTRSAGSMVDCGDWFECHPYIDVQVRDGKRYCARPINTLGKFVDEVLSINRTDKCVGFLPTCFSYRYQSMYSEYPNFAEMVCHTWAAMLPGAKTLWPYAYHDLNDRACLYEGIRYVFSSFEALENLILLANRTELVRNTQIHAVHYKLNDEEMFVLANLLDEPQSITLDGISGTWHHFRHGGTITNNTFELKPYEVVIGTSKIRDTGLPTYQETAALIDNLEYQRTHNGNVFFDRQGEMSINGSNGNGRYKLFDGIPDNYAWECNGEGKYFEMDITKFRPTFSKVVVHGFQIDDMELKVRNNGELTLPAVKEVKNERFSKTYIFAEPISPDCLRMEFGNHRVELYEIEAF